MSLREYLVVVLFERWTFRTEGMRRFHRRQCLVKRGIGHPRADPVAPEIVGEAVGPFIGQPVGEIVVPAPQDAGSPYTFTSFGTFECIAVERADFHSLGV